MSVAGVVQGLESTSGPLDPAGPEVEFGGEGHHACVRRPSEHGVLGVGRMRDEPERDAVEDGGVLADQAGFDHAWFPSDKFMYHAWSIIAALAENEAKIVDELDAAQGAPQDLGGYYMRDFARAEAAMRPSATLNAIIGST